jgi:5-methylcytosine-specific restriction endonuclease McrA
VKNLGYKRIMVTLSDVPDDVLVDRLLHIRKHERSLLIELLRYLGEMDRRRAVLALGYSSLFSFCVDALGLTKAAAFRRTTAARLMARFPLAADYLMDGRLNLTTLVDLRDVLDESHLVEILDGAAGRTEDQVKELVAKLRPQPAPSDLLRKLPTHRNDCTGSGPAPATTAQPERPVPATAPRAPTSPPLAAATRAPACAASEARLQPIAAERHVLRVTVGAAFVADLTAIREALSHQLPGGGLEEVLHECIRSTLESIERRRRGGGKKTASKAPPTGSRYVPVAVRGEVWTRDDGRCTFVGRTGHRCASRHQLQLHHIDPFANGGPPTATNLTLRCSAHNLHAAEQDYGRDHIDRKIAANRARNGAAAGEVLPGLF